MKTHSTVARLALLTVLVAPACGTAGEAAEGDVPVLQRTSDATAEPRASEDSSTGPDATLSSDGDSEPTSDVTTGPDATPLEADSEPEGTSDVAPALDTPSEPDAGPPPGPQPITEPPPVPPASDQTYNVTWEPSLVGQCDPELNASPGLVHAGLVAAEEGQRMIEPSVLFADETFTLVRRSSSQESDIAMEWSGFEVAGDESAPRLYDDGTHGDATAGDGLFTRACLSYPAGQWGGQPYGTRYDIWFLDPALRGTETVTEVAAGVRVNDAGFFLSLGDSYGQRRVNGWSLHSPSSCTACQHAWSTAGDVFDFFVVGTRDALGGAGYVRVHDFIEGTGFSPSCAEKSHCYDLVDGREHAEWMGVIWMPWPGVQGMTHELGHGLLGMEAHDFPGPDLQAWNSGDGMHVDSDTTATGTLSGPFWDPDRGWPHAVVLEDSEGARSETYLVRDDAGAFRIAPVDHDRYVWADIFLYMMGILSADEVTTTYHKLVGPQLQGCITEEQNLVCTDDLVTADEVIPFTAQDFVTQFGPWGTSQPFEPTDLRIGVLNISDRPHTTAEMTWFTKVYRDYATSPAPKGEWADDVPWSWATRGLGAVNIDAQAMVTP